MLPSIRRVFVVLVLLLPSTLPAQDGLAAAQQEAFAVPASPATVPPYVRFSGRALDVDGRPRSGVTGITFALYEQQQGGAPVWLETHNVTPDADGRYSVLLGANSRDGLPVEFFASGEARWLGVRAEGGAEQPRVMLVSVPYALKAAEAERLAGRSASDFVLNEKLAEQVRQEVEAAATESNKAMTTTGGGTLAVTASGTPGKVAKFTGVDALGDSTITESGANVGVGTTSPPNRFAINSTSAILPSTMQISHPGGDWGLVFKRTFNDAGHPNFTFLKTRGETAVAAQSGDGMGRIVWQAVNAAGSPAPVYAGELSMYVTTVSGVNIASDMRFYTKPLTGGLVERMRISPDGFVGVGTASPPNRFAINATTAVLPSTMQISHPGGDWGLVFKRNVNDAGHPNFTFLKTRGEGAVPALTGDGIGRIVWQAVNGSGIPVYVGDMSMVATSVTAGDVASDMRFSTRSTTVGLAERMRITPEGRVGIGTTSPSTTLHVNGTLTATAFIGDGSQITGISAGTAIDVDCIGCVHSADIANSNVTTEKIADGALTVAKLSFDPATQTELDAEAAGRAAADAALSTDVNGRVSKSGDTMVGALNLPANGLLAGTNQLVLASDRVGIGVSTPAQKLDVAGTVKASAFEAEGNVKLGTSAGLFAPGGVENLRILRGLINSDATVFAGTGFTVVKSSTGTYQITYAEAFPVSPAVFFTPVGVEFRRFAIVPSNLSGASVVVKFTDSAGNLVDTPFDFLMVGAR